MNTYADDLATLVEKLGLKNAIHVGHSTARGEVARYIVAKCPSRGCGYMLPPQEQHKCSGFVPEYSDVPPKERMEMRRASSLEAGDWDDDQYDSTTPGDGAEFILHEAETGETKDQVVIEGMDEDEYLRWKFGYVPDPYDMCRPRQREQIAPGRVSERRFVSVGNLLPLPTRGTIR